MDTALSLSRVEIDRLADDIADTAAHIDVATHRLLGQIRDFDRSEGWGLQGALSCAHWMSWRIGMGLGAAREKVRVARALGGLPLVDGAFERGELSYSKVRAMTRVATPDNEEILVTMGRCTTAAQLEKLCRLYRPIQTGDAAKVDGERRSVTSRPTDDGMVSIQIRVRPDEASRILAAIEANTHGGDLADGAVALADLGLSRAAPDQQVRPPVEVVVHVSAETLTGATDRSDGVPAEVCRRLLCDAGVVPMVADQAGKTIDVGRRTRTIPPALRRALEARDHGCRLPGCTNRRFVDAHHVEHWIDGGATSLENTMLLCRRHHTAIHEDGFTLVMDDGVPRFADRLGRPIVDAPPRRRLESAVVIEAGRAVFPGWDGDPVDYAMCVGALGQLDGLCRPAARFVM